MHTCFTWSVDVVFGLSTIFFPTFFHFYDIYIYFFFFFFFFCLFVCFLSFFFNVTWRCWYLWVQLLSHFYTKLYEKFMVLRCACSLDIILMLFDVVFCFVSFFFFFFFCFFFFFFFFQASLLSENTTYVELLEISPTIMNFCRFILHALKMCIYFLSYPPLIFLPTVSLFFCFYCSAPPPPHPLATPPHPTLLKGPIK